MREFKMTKIKLSYPVSYKDELSYQQACTNFLKISPFKKEVFLAIYFLLSSVRVSGARDFSLLRIEGFTPPIISKHSKSTTHQFRT